MLVRICPVAWDSNKSWTQGKGGQSCCSCHTTLSQRAFPKSVDSYMVRGAGWCTVGCAEDMCVVVAELALSSVYSSVPSGCHSGLQSCDTDWIVIFAVVGAGFSGLFRLGKRVWGDCLERTSECWQLCADTPWVVGLLIFLLLYTHQSKEFTEDEARSFAGSLPKALQLLTAVLEKSLEQLPQAFRAEWKVSNRLFQKCKGWLRVHKAFSDHILAFKLQGALAQIQKRGCFGNKSKADMVSPPHTPSNPPFPLLLQPQISSNVLSHSQQLRPEIYLHTNSTTKKVFFFMAVLFYWVQGLCFH